MAAMRFKREDYRRMAKRGSVVVKSFELCDMQVAFHNDATAVPTYHVQQGVKGILQQTILDSSKWVRTADRWRCALHTETPAETKAKY